MHILQILKYVFTILAIIFILAWSRTLNKFHFYAWLGCITISGTLTSIYYFNI